MRRRPMHGGVEEFRDRANWSIRSQRAVTEVTRPQAVYRRYSDPFIR
jgi:hypothetical protein